MFSLSAGVYKFVAVEQVKGLKSGWNWNDI